MRNRSPAPSLPRQDLDGLPGHASYKGMTDFSLIRTMAREAWGDAYMLSLRAPSARRPFLWGLIACLDALTLIERQVKEPTLRLIRLRWWRDNLGKDIPGQPVLQALATEPLCLPMLDALVESFEEPSLEIDRIFWRIWVNANMVPEDFIRMASFMRGSGLVDAPEKIDLKYLPKSLYPLAKAWNTGTANPHWRGLRILLGF